MKTNTVIDTLKKIKNEDLKTYQFGLAIHHYNSGNSPLAFQFFYKVIEQDPDILESYLFKIMKQMKQSDYAWEQHDLIVQKPKFIHKEENDLKDKFLDKNMFIQNLKKDLIVKDHNAIYFYLLSTNKPIREDALRF